MSIIRVMMFVILAACAGSSVLEDAFKKCGRGSLFAIHLLFICLFLNLFHVIPLMFIAAEVLTILVSFSHTSQIANLVPSHVHGGILAIIVPHPPSFQRVSTCFNVGFGRRSRSRSGHTPLDSGVMTRLLEFPNSMKSVERTLGHLRCFGHIVVGNVQRCVS